MPRNFEFPDLILRIVSIVFAIFAAGLLASVGYDSRVHDRLYNVFEPFFFSIIVCLLCSVVLVVLLIVGLHSNEDIARTHAVFHVFGGLLLIITSSLLYTRVHTLKQTAQQDKQQAIKDGNIFNTKTTAEKIVDSEQKEKLYGVLGSGAILGGIIQAVVMFIIRFISKSKLTILDSRALACNLGLLAFLFADIAVLKINENDIIRTEPDNAQQEAFRVGNLVCFFLSVTFLIISTVLDLEHPMYILSECVYHALAAVFTFSISIVFILEVNEAKERPEGLFILHSKKRVGEDMGLDNNFFRYGAAAAAFGVAFGLALALIAVFIFLRYQRSAV